MGVIKFFFDCMMALIPPLMFVPQLINMKKEMNVRGYSKVVSLLIIVSNLMRLCYRIGVEFSHALVFQSIFQVMLQIYVVYEILKMQEKFDSVPASQRHDSRIRKYIGNFWDWDEFKYYMIAIASIAAGLFTVSILMSPFYWYFEVVGIVSILMEAVLSLPQYLKNRRERSVEGLSILVVCGWVCGDAFKLAYYFITRQPILFCWCSFAQLTIDGAILYQFSVYSQKSIKSLVSSNISTLYSAIPANYLPVSIPPVGLDDSESEKSEPDKNPDTDIKDDSFKI